MFRLTHGRSLGELELKEVREMLKDVTQTIDALQRIERLLMDKLTFDERYGKASPARKWHRENKQKADDLYRLVEILESKIREDFDQARELEKQIKRERELAEKEK